MTTQAPTSAISSDERKWDILHTFCYAYICQPPQEYWEDKQFMEERDFLLRAVKNNVHVTDWKQILREYSQMRPITLSVRHAKEFYEAEVQNASTEAYRAIKSYFLKTDREREIIRANPGCDISYITLYLREGEAYRKPTESWTMETKTKKKAK
jgi:hypothetical protein